MLSTAASIHKVSTLAICELKCQTTESSRNQQNCSSDVFVANVRNTDVWHARLEHASAEIVRLLPVSCDKKILDICNSCFFPNRQH